MFLWGKSYVYVLYLLSECACWNSPTFLESCEICNLATTVTRTHLICFPSSPTYSQSLCLFCFLVSWAILSHFSHLYEILSFFFCFTILVPLFLITSLPAHWIRLKHVFDIPYHTSSLSYRYKDYNFFFKENLLILPSLIFLLCSLLLFWQFCWNMFLKPIQLPFKFLNKPVSWETKTSKHRPM